MDVARLVHCRIHYSRGRDHRSVSYWLDSLGTGDELPATVAHDLAELQAGISTPDTTIEYASFHGGAAQELTGLVLRFLFPGIDLNAPDYGSVSRKFIYRTEAGTRCIHAYHFTGTAEQLGGVEEQGLFRLPGDSPFAERCIQSVFTETGHRLSYFTGYRISFNRTIAVGGHSRRPSITAHERFLWARGIDSGLAEIASG